VQLRPASDPFSRRLLEFRLMILQRQPQSRADSSLQHHSRLISAAEGSALIEMGNTRGIPLIAKNAMSGAPAWGDPAAPSAEAAIALRAAETLTCRRADSSGSLRGLN